MRLIRSLLILLVLIGYQANALVAIPAYSQRIVDTTDTLTSTQVTELENRLTDYEVTKGDQSQVAILLISTLDDESIEQYALRVFDSWKIGKKGVDNGILLLIVKDDRQVRIEVGYGFEGDLPDLKAQRIIDQKIIPAFRDNNYYQGINDALTAIIGILINGEQNQLDSINEISTVKDIFNDKFGEALLNYAGISFVFCLFIGRILPFSTLKKSNGKRSLVTGLLNGISTGGFTLVNHFPITTALPIFFLAFVASTLLSAIFNISRSGGNSYRGPRGGSGGGFGGSRGGFGGGGGGRSGGGGASGRW